ncbi:MAG: nitrous oxide-stimulated promoter family protein [Roseburia hominis]
MEKMTAQEIEQEACRGERKRPWITHDRLPTAAGAAIGTKAGRTLRGVLRSCGAYAGSLATENARLWRRRRLCECCRNAVTPSKGDAGKIRTRVMKCAGPRMPFVHPPLAIRHVHITLRNKKKQKESQYKGKGRETCFIKDC